MVRVVVNEPATLLSAARDGLYDAHAHLDRRTHATLKSALAALQASMKEANCSGAAVLQLPVDRVHESTQEWVSTVASVPGLLPFAYVDPALGGDVNMWVGELIPLGLRGLKFHPRLARTPITHATYDQALRAAHIFDLPVVICGLLNWEATQLGSSIAAFGELAQRHNGVRISVAHCGAPKILDAMLLAKACENIFLDLSFGPRYFRHSSVPLDVRHLVWGTRGERIMFGSDTPENSILGELEWVSRCLSSSHGELPGHSVLFSPREMQLVARDNFLQFIGAPLAG